MNGDAELVKRCISGSEQAWVEFYSHYTGLIRSIIKRHLGLQDQSIDDILQDVFLLVIPALKQYDSSQSLTRYVAIIAERASIQEYRKRSAGKRDAKTISIAPHDDYEELGHVPTADTKLQDEQLIEKDTSNKLSGFVQGLGQKCKELLELRYFMDMPFKTIAAKMNSSENTVTVQTKRCIEQLKKLISGLD
jgi:RNA polymerase sigma factor (sigma-70 family)